MLRRPTSTRTRRLHVRDLDSPGSRIRRTVRCRTGGRREPGGIARGAPATPPPGPSPARRSPRPAQRVATAADGRPSAADHTITRADDTHRPPGGGEVTTTPQRCRGRRCRAAGRVGTAPRYHARARPVADGAEVYPPHAAGAARPGSVLPGGSPHAPFRSRSSSEAGYFPRRSLDRLPGLLRGLGEERRTPAGVLAAGENFPFVADEKVTARRPRTGRGG